MAIVKIVSGLMLVGNACLAAYIFRMETKRDELKADIALADADLAMFESIKNDLVWKGERSVDIFRRASVAWRDSAAMDEHVRVNAFLDIIEWIQSVYRLPDETLKRSDMLIKANFDRYSLIYAQAQNEYSEKLEENKEQISTVRSSRDCLRQDLRVLERRINLIRAIFHLITITALIIALFDPAGPRAAQE